MDVLGVGVVAEALVIAGEADDVPDTQDGRAQDVGLHGEAVAVAAGHLHDRLEAVLLGLEARGDGQTRTTAVWLSVMLTAST